MELLDRYLKAVRTYLPHDQADDILKELAENLLSQREDREADLGRSLTTAEQEALLKQHGSPIQVAGRYLSEQRTVSFGRQFIGPVTFPIYAKVLRINLAISLASIVLIMFALHVPASNIFSTIVTQMLIQFTVITIIFSAAEVHWAKNPDEWLSRKSEKEARSSEPPRVSRTESLSQLAALSVFFVCLRAVISSPSIIAGPLELAEVWHQIYAPLALLTIAGMLQAMVNLIRPRWTWLRLATRVVTGVGWLAILWYLTRAGVWVVLSGATTKGIDEQQLAFINKYAFYNLLAAIVISAVIIGFDIWRLTRNQRNKPLTRAV